jgi:glycerophosphoryl diester phosphodiesterase
LAYPNHEEILSLNEFDPDDVRRTGSQFWGPRWTLGTQNAAVEAMHQDGRRVITWTMDDPQFINEYIKEGNFDGMVTNYPTLVAYYYWVK